MFGAEKRDGSCLLFKNKMSGFSPLTDSALNPDPLENDRKATEASISFFLSEIWAPCAHEELWQSLPLPGMSQNLPEPAQLCSQGSLRNPTAHAAPGRGRQGIAAWGFCSQKIRGQAFCLCQNWDPFILSSTTGPYLSLMMDNLALEAYTDTRMFKCVSAAAEGNALAITRLA